MRCRVIPALVLAALHAQLGCGTPVDDDGPQTTAKDGIRSQSQGVAVQHIVENPAAYDGRAVTLTGEVVDVWSPRVFTVIDRRFAGGSALLVVARQAVPEFRDGTSGGANPQGLTVHLSGVVRLDPIATIEREAGVEVSPAVQSLGRVKGPILLAERVVLPRGYE